MTADRYHRLLWAYPSWYREARGDEIVDTLIESDPGRDRPTLRQAADLTRAGLLTRFGFGYVPGLAGGAALAAPVALAVVGGLGAFLWLSRPCCSPAAATLAPAIWPVVTGLVVLWPHLGRFFIGLALVVVPAVAATDVGAAAVRTTEFLVPAAFAVVAAIGWRPQAPHARLVAGLGAPVVLLATMVLGTVIPAREVFPVPRVAGELRTSIGRVEALDATMLHPLAPAWLGLVLLAGAAGLVVVRGRRDRRWLWFALLLAIPAAPLTRMAVVWIGNAGFRLPWYPQAMLTAVAVAAGVVAGIWVGGRHPGPRTGPGTARTGGLATAASVALAGAAGLAAAQWLHGEWLAEGVWVREPFGPYRTLGPLAYAAWLAAIGGYAFAGPRTGRVLTAVALLITAALPLAAVATGFTAPDGAVLAPLVTLGVVALSAMPARPGPPGQPLWGVVFGAAVLCLAGLAVVVASDRYDITVPARIAGLAAVPYAIVAVVAALALRRADGRPIAPTVVVAVAVIGLSGVVPATYSEYGVAVVAGLFAAATGLVWGTMCALRGRA
jgi:hypothetical protein